MGTTSDSYHLVREDGRTNRKNQSSEETIRSESQPGKYPLDLRRRRRVLRACDECRRMRVGCDGRQPCSHCTLGYECTYNNPQKRGRDTQQYIQALEARLRKAEESLKTSQSGLNENDQGIPVASPEQKSSAFHQKKNKSPKEPNLPVNTSPPHRKAADDEDEFLMETMMENFGSLDLDDQGHWDYHGHSSSTIFMKRHQFQFGELITPVHRSSRSRPMTHALGTTVPQVRSRQCPKRGLALPPTYDLPLKEVAKLLCRSSFDRACVMLRFVHEPSFWAMLDRIYATSWDQFSHEEHTFLPLLYIVLGVGCLFSDEAESARYMPGSEGKFEQAFEYLGACQRLLDITDCRDLTTLQAICFMIVFLQSSAKLSTCYSYIGIAQRAALRLGLHRLVVGNFNPIECELRKRIFWVIRSMDIYVSTQMGLPLMGSNDDIDQEYPLEINDEYITQTEILPMPSGQTSIMAGANAHTRLVYILTKVVRYVYPVRPAKHETKSDRTYMVSYSKIREIEQDLKAWTDSLPLALKPGSKVSAELDCMRQLLQISYAHVKWILYRPFLHSISNSFQAQNVDKRSYTCAAACINVSRAIIYITAGMYKNGILSGSYWFASQATYFAVLTLVFYILENPGQQTTIDRILEDALEGKNTLMGIAQDSMATNRCARLYSLFKYLPDNVHTRPQSTAQPVNLQHPRPLDNLPKSTVQDQPSSMSLPSEASQPSEASPIRHTTSQPRQISTSGRTPKSINYTRRYDRSRIRPSDQISNKAASFSTHSIAFTDARISSGSLLNQSAAQGQLMTQQYDINQPIQNFTPTMVSSDNLSYYPSQPTSTLENGYFRDDLSALSMQFPQDPNSDVSSTLSNRFELAYATIASDRFRGERALSGVSGTRIHTSSSPQSEQLGLQLEARLSSSQSTSEPPQSPDMLSLPQNFVWQGFDLNDLAQFD